MIKAQWCFDQNGFRKGPFALVKKEGEWILEKTESAEPGSLLMPGLVNFHCHLELTNLKGKLQGHSGFTQWVQDLRQATEDWTSKDWEDSVALGIQESIESGVTQIVDVGNSGANLRVDSNISVWAIQELMGTKEEVALERFEIAKGNLERFQKKGIVGQLGIHAPYSSGIELMKRVREEQDLFLLHVSESKEEQAFFQRQEGPLWNMAKWINPDLKLESQYACSGEYLASFGQVKNADVWVHANTLTDESLSLVEQNALTLVTCPRSREYYSHPRPRIEEWSRRKLEWVVGTDSAASCANLNLWEDLRALQNEFQIPFAELLWRSTFLAKSKVPDSKPWQWEQDALLVQWKSTWTPDQGIEDLPLVQKVFFEGEIIYER